MTLLQPSKRSDDPEGFSRIGEAIWFVKPEVPSHEIDKAHPTLILIFGWMDAKPAHVAKFSAGYRKLYPSTPQIVVGSTNVVFTRSTSRLVSKLQPALDQLVALNVFGPNARPHRILTHTLSNGGAIRLNHLSLLLASQPTLANSLVPAQPSLMIMDSTPGGDSPKSAINVFRTTIPSPLLRWIFLFFLFSFHLFMVAIRRSPWKIFEPLRAAMLNPRWLPWIASPSVSTRFTTPYLFIYSKSDEAVPFKDIQAFTERTEKIFPVKREIYENTPHVSHMRNDPARYWSVIGKTWLQASNLE